MIKDYYFLLGLPRSASLKEIKQAYRKLAAQYHPDRVSGQGPEALEHATVKMTELNEAFKVLSNPESKAEYDQQVELIPERTIPRPRPESRPTPTPPPTPAQPKSAPSPPPPPRPEPRVTHPAQARPEAALDGEYGQRLKTAISSLPLKWKERVVRGWEWGLEADELRRSILVLYRAMDSLSRLSVRWLESAVPAIVDTEKSALRRTYVLAAVHVGRLMDAAVVRQSLQALTGTGASWPGNVQVLLVLREGKSRPVLYGVPGDDARLAQVSQVLLKAS